MMQREQMNIVFTGHVDHGKSTVVGRLLSDTGSLPEGKLEQIRKDCERNSKPFEYAFLLDALKDEQSQGITIDAARVFFSSDQRDYIIIDAPGHIEFLKNMITGAARAEAAFLVIDAEEGIQENSRRHGYLLSMLGIRQVCVVVNKMDLVDYNQQVYNKIVRKFTRFLKSINLHNVEFVPVSGREGDNVYHRMEKMNWFKGYTVLELLDKFKKGESHDKLPMRMPVTDIYKFTNYDDNRRIIAGTVETGTFKQGDEIIFYPSGKKSKISTIESFNTEPLTQATAGMATGFTMDEQIYLSRGALACRVDEMPPKVGNCLKVSLFWLGREPLVPGKEYYFKTGTSKVRCQLTEITKVIDASSLDAQSKKEKVERHEVADCIFTLQKAIAFDLVMDLPQTSRFVLVDEYEIAGGGIIRDVDDHHQNEYGEKLIKRQLEWENGIVTELDRMQQYQQRPALILVTGELGGGKKEFAEQLEKKLFTLKKNVYYLGYRSLKYGLDSDLRDGRQYRRTQVLREEHIRRISEISHIMMDAGMFFIVKIDNLTFEERDMIQLLIGSSRLKIIWVGKKITTDISPDWHVKRPEAVIDHMEEVDKIMENWELMGDIT
ncbi:adenylyl-sulfate kinase [Oceanispirochaeta sp. M2]|nr:adenylyl-sulfate kinase [Oceanispirochaeta sp. M2]NPD72249.1 adenylyl-sulfate kinase [Oceanispirochaeta sp. M1]